jgi:2-hydroxychromene-2-carboxylate isomerase
VEGQDVNEVDTIRHAAQSVGLDADEVLHRAAEEEVGRAVSHALAAFDREEIPGVPTWVVNGKRFWGKDRVEWLVQEVKLMVRSL